MGGIPNIVNCKGCGKPVESGTYCGNCGTLNGAVNPAVEIMSRIEKNSCPHCKAPNQIDIYCTACGEEMKK